MNYFDSPFLLFANVVTEHNEHGYVMKVYKDEPDGIWLADISLGKNSIEIRSLGKEGMIYGIPQSTLRKGV